MAEMSMQTSPMTINNYQLDFEAIYRAYQHYDDKFFFCPHGIRSVIEFAAIRIIKESSNHNPLKCDDSLLADVIVYVELFLDKYVQHETKDNRQYESLKNSDTLFDIEMVVSQVEETVGAFLDSGLPKQQMDVFKPRWVGNILTFGLRIY